LAGLRDSARLKSDPERAYTVWEGSKLAAAGSCIGPPEYRPAGRAGRDLLEQHQPLPAHAVFGEAEPGGIAARPSQALDKAAADRVADVHEYDRHRTGRLK